MPRRLSDGAAMIWESAAGQGGGCNCNPRAVLKASMSLPIRQAVSFPPIHPRSCTDTTAHYRTLSSPLFHRTGTKTVDCSKVFCVCNLRFSSKLALAGVRPASAKILRPRLLSGGSRSAVIRQYPFSLHLLSSWWHLLSSSTLAHTRF